MVGESGVPMMPFHHDSGERGAMAVDLERVCLWDVVRNLVCLPRFVMNRYRPENGADYLTDMHAPGVPACFARGPRQLV
jgi:hypothetical protein